MRSLRFARAVSITVAGGLASVVLSIFRGSRLTLLTALALHALALVAFARIRRGLDGPHPSRVAERREEVAA